MNNTVKVLLVGTGIYFIGWVRGVKATLNTFNKSYKLVRVEIKKDEEYETKK